MGCKRVTKGLWVRDGLETEQTAPYWLQIPLSLATLLSHSAGQLNRGSWEPSFLWELVLTKVSYLQLTCTVCCTGLYHCLTPTCFLWASHLHPIQPIHGQGYILMSSTGCISFSIDEWADGQYVTSRKHGIKSAWLLFWNYPLAIVKLRLKIDLVSYPARAEGLVNMISNSLPKIISFHATIPI